MKALRVLHVSAYFAPAFVYGGPPRTIHALCKALGSVGVDVDVMTTTANGPGEPLQAAVDEPRIVDGVKARYFPIAAPRWLWRARGLRRAVDACVSDYDVVHIHGLWHSPGWQAAAAARRAHVPYVISPRGMFEPDAMAIRSWRKALAFRAVERRNLTGAACLHATSGQEAKTLSRHGFGARLLVAPNGVDAEALMCPDPAPLLRRSGIDPSSRFVLYMGRIHPIKRLDLLAGAAAQLRARQVSVVIAGPDEREHRAAMAPMFERLGVQTCWIGAVDGPLKAALLTGARALVLCSDSESFGMSVAEAMAVGTPVVTTHSCPWPQVEREGAGYWVPQSSEAIARALDELLEDETRARAMGTRGRALAAAYTWPATARMLASEYHRLTDFCATHVA
jgi:glycosyltransferase involved in cell wall biosynthesis